MNTQVKVKSLQLEAQAIGEKVLESLKESGGVLSAAGAFDHALYLEGSNNELIKVIQNEHFQGPMSILVESDEVQGFRSQELPEKMEIKFEDDLLISSCGTISINLKDSSVFSLPEVPEPDNMISLEGITLNLRILKDIIFTAPSREGLVPLLENIEKLGPMQLYTKEQQPSMAEKARPFIDRLMWGIFGGDIEAVKNSAQEIIGLGPGLTPSCDDFLAGLLLSINTAGRSIFRSEPETIKFFEKLSDEISALAKDKTTIYSQSLLNEAALGHGPVNAFDLIISIVTKGPEGINEPAKKLLEAGETSGADIAIGVYYGIRFLCSRIEMKELLEFE